METLYSIVEALPSWTQVGNFQLDENNEKLVQLQVKSGKPLNNLEDAQEIVSALKANWDGFQISGNLQGKQINATVPNQRR